MIKSKISGAFGSSVSSIKERLAGCKVKFVLTLIFTILGLIIGVVVAVRLNNCGDIENAVDYGFVETNLTSNGLFWRVASSIIFLALLIVLSLNIFLYPLAIILLIYKAYLIGLNVVLQLITKGLTGLVLSLLIVLPCQLLLLLALVIFFCIYSSNIRNCGGNNFKIAGFALVIIGCISLLESLLLILLGANLLFVA